MKLTNNSIKLINYINKIISTNNVIPDNTNITNNTSNVFSLFYYILHNGYNYINNNIIIDPLITNKIIYPTTFSSNSFKPIIKSNIQTTIKTCISYSIFFIDKTINIHFFTSKKNVNYQIYNNYVKNMLVWIYTITLFSYSKKTCLQKVPLTIYVYHTELEKKLPSKKGTTLDIEHVNTAFTYSCPTNKAEIVIFRKEEWFKVFIHETFHTFGLDFSIIDTNECNKIVSELFFINIKIGLYEAYSEFWARLINVFFCSYNLTNNITEFNTLTSQLITFEIIFTQIQAVKVLKYMNLTYFNLIEHDYSVKTKYRENTNVFAYYIITSILLSNYNSFLKWCNINNPNNNIIKFKNNKKHITEFCKFIKEHSKTFLYLRQIQNIQNMYNIIDKTNLLNSTLRMSVCELE
jgi:hypothetical protein